MSDVTRILSQIESGDPSAAEQLLPLVYEELRKLAAAKLAQEKPGQTLQATALGARGVPAAGPNNESADWNSRGHFFGAAAEAMRRILVEHARRKKSHQGGGAVRRLRSTVWRSWLRNRPSMCWPSMTYWSGFNASTTSPLSWSSCVTMRA